MNGMSFWILDDVPPTMPNKAERRQQVVNMVSQCKRWLEVSGFEVLVAQRRLKQPRIVIQHDPVLCAALEGVQSAYEHTVKGRRWYSFVLRFGVMVEWEAA